MTGTGKAIRWSTAAAVIGVATVAAVVSYEHAYALVHAHGETGWTAHILPLTVDGLIWASSMVMLDSCRRDVPVPSLARWLLGLGIAATLAANVAHGLGHGLIGASVGAWPALALVGSYELLMMIIRGTQQAAGNFASETGQAVAGVPHALQAQAAEEFAEDVTAGRLPSIRVIRARLHVGQPRAQLVRAYLTMLAAVCRPQAHQAKYTPLCASTEGWQMPAVIVAYQGDRLTQHALFRLIIEQACHYPDGHCATILSTPYEGARLWRPRGRPISPARVLQRSTRDASARSGTSHKYPRSVSLSEVGPSR